MGSDKGLLWVFVSAQRSRRRPQSNAAALPTDPVKTDFGSVSLVADPGAPRRITLYLDGVPSSHHDLDDPTYLEFKYMVWMAGMLNAWFPQDAAVRAMHLGAAGCTMARYISATRPGSHQLALEVDAQLAQYVREWFDLPRSPQLRIRVQDGREALEGSPPNRWEVIIRDAFMNSSVPDGLVSTSAAAAVHTALSADGIYLANCADHPPMSRARREVATLSQFFGSNVLIAAEPGIFSGRRHGNVILMAAKNGERLREVSAEIGKKLRQAREPARVVGGAELQAFASGASPY